MFQIKFNLGPVAYLWRDLYEKIEAILLPEIKAFTEKKSILRVNIRIEVI